jgi:hypothetical protein
MDNGILQIWIYGNESIKKKKSALKLERASFLFVDLDVHYRSWEWISAL